MSGADIVGNSISATEEAKGGSLQLPLKVSALCWFPSGTLRGELTARGGWTGGGVGTWELWCCWSDQACHLLLQRMISTMIELPLIATPKPENVARRIDSTACTFTNE